MREDNVKLILVDIDDNETGIGKKLETHEKGLLHRAFSVFIMDGDEMFIQKRADGKYHSGGLWTNACCSHPRPGMTLTESVHTRMKLEIGIDCPVEELFSFVYRAEFPDGLSEYEYDHVFIGHYPKDKGIELNTEEASEAKWIKIDTLKKELIEHPERFTAWFLIATPTFLKKLKEKNKEE